MIRRAIGLVLFLVGLAGVTICYLGAKSGLDLADNVASSADGVLETATAALHTVEGSLEQSRRTISNITDTIGLVQSTSNNLASTVDDTQPMFDEMTRLVGQDIPSTISDVQDTIPNLVQTAKVVDDTLRLLSRLQVRETVPLINYEINFGLGVEYDPEVPFDQAVQELGRGLAPIAVASSNLEGELQTTKANMALLSQDLTELAVDLERLNEEVSAFRPLLDEYSTVVTDMRDEIGRGRERLDDQLALAKQVIVLAAVWLGLSQLLPVFIGAELIMGNRMVRLANEPSDSPDQMPENSAQDGLVADHSDALDEVVDPSAGNVDLNGER